MTLCHQVIKVKRAITRFCYMLFSFSFLFFRLKLSSLSQKADWPKSSVTSRGYLPLDISACNLEVFWFYLHTIIRHKEHIFQWSGDASLHSISWYGIRVSTDKYTVITGLHDIHPLSLKARPAVTRLPLKTGSRLEARLRPLTLWRHISRVSPLVRGFESQLLPVFFL